MKKTPGIKILIALPIIFIAFLFVLSRPWENQSITEIYIESYKKGKKGIIKKEELWKGCVLYLKFYDKNRTYLSFKEDTSSVSLAGGCELINIIQKNDYFQKLPNSNKCFIVRNDSIMLFDCNDLFKSELKDTIQNIIKWKPKKKNKWIKLTPEFTQKYLQNNLYRKYKKNN